MAADDDRDIRQTITISVRGDLWFATSEDEPPIFVSSHTRAGMAAALAHVLTDQAKHE